MTNQAKTDSSQPSPSQTIEEIAEQLAAKLVEHCEREHMTIGNRRCCRELIAAALRAAEGRATASLRADLQTLATTWRAHGSWQGEHYADAVKELLEKDKT